jgi:hypothetical protein
MDVERDFDDFALLAEHHLGGAARWGIFSDLDETKLETMREMLLSFRDNDHGKLLLSYWIGVTTTMLVERYGFCAACGTNHAAALGCTS